MEICWTQYTKLEDIEKMILELDDEAVAEALLVIKPQAE